MSSNKKAACTYAGLAAFAGISYYLLLADYLLFDANFFIGIIMLPYVVIVREKGNYSYRYFAIAATFLLISAFVPMRSIHYLATSATLLFILESYVGKLNYLPWFLLFVLAPGFKYLTTVFGFPIRLQLSELAGAIINSTGYQAEVKGNIIEINGYEFAVDAACIGLQMMITSFLIGIFLVAYYERKTVKKLSFLFTSIAMASVGALNIFCNLIRIVVLVLFKLLPDSQWHYLVGILCLVAYVIIPLNFIIKWLFARTYLVSPMIVDQSHKSTYLFMTNSLLCMGVLLIGLQIKSIKSTIVINPAQYTLAGYSKELLPSGVIKFVKRSALVYVKPIAKQYGIEHNPMICWQGSGYTFKNINTVQINDTEIYIGELTKDGDIIHTAWWFDNGTQKTINPLSWRWRVLKGEQEFSLINVNASDKSLLVAEVAQLFHTKVMGSE